MNIKTEKRKIDKIIIKVQNRINKKGAYENAGQEELRKYTDTLGFENYQERCELLNYFYEKIDNLNY